jgi:hypothetical protein
MDIVTQVIISLTTLICKAVDGWDSVIIIHDPVEISALDITIAFAIAYDVLIFYRRMTDNPLNIASDMYEIGTNGYSNWKSSRPHMGRSDGGSRANGSGQLSPQRVSLTNPKSRGFTPSSKSVGSFQWRHR